MYKEEVEYDLMFISILCIAVKQRNFVNPIVHPLICSNNYVNKNSFSHFRLHRPREGGSRVRRSGLGSGLVA